MCHLLSGFLFFIFFSFNLSKPLKITHHVIRENYQNLVIQNIFKKWPLVQYLVYSDA